MTKLVPGSLTLSFNANVSFEPMVLTSPFNLAPSTHLHEPLAVRERFLPNLWNIISLKSFVITERSVHLRTLE